MAQATYGHYATYQGRLYLGNVTIQAVWPYDARRMAGSALVDAESVRAARNRKMVANNLYREAYVTLKDGRNYIKRLDDATEPDDSALSHIMAVLQHNGETPNATTRQARPRKERAASVKLADMTPEERKAHKRAQRNAITARYRANKRGA